MTTLATLARPSTAVLTDGVLDLVISGARARLRPRGPFDLAAARRSVGRWSPVSRHEPRPAEPLRLTFVSDTDHLPVAVAITGDGGDLVLDVAGADGSEGVARAVAQAARVLSLDHDASGIDDVARRVPELAPVLAEHRGLRPMLFGSPYEAAAWAVISPRIGMRQAAAVQRRLAEDHGARLDVAGGTVAAFPVPEALLACEEVPGLPAEKVRRLHGVARAALHGDLDVDRLRGLGATSARAALRELHGIGPFWASGIWLRACGVVDEWPDEPRSAAALASIHGLDPAVTEDPVRLAELTGPLAPYRMWLAFLLRMTS